ncbi:hypothetical protein EO92_17480 [Methanosarcina sp. 2.H.A.1B.4]|nr:hypothetical protein EO92_17480 [Methanosarcina sp. 2.H.A.1B.4]KKH49987.1 hypothetical protein EO93_16615 [Methanosarcina sp. 1.H.A.2.2]
MPHRAKSTFVGLCRRHGRERVHIKTKVSREKNRFFREIPASQGIPNFVKTEKKQGKPDFSSKSSEELFFPDLVRKIFFFDFYTL